MEIDQLLKLVVQKGASDLFICTGVPPSVKVNGKMLPVTKSPLSPDKTREIVFGVMDEAQRKEFARDKEANFAISSPGVGRFRVSAYYQRNLVGMVLRRIETHIPTIEELKLPKIIGELAMSKRGIVIFAGATGTGKSTSLAAMIGHRNKNSHGHIICIEDPIEYIHKHSGCIVTQREVGLDTESFDVALKNTLRQAPDVIMIGEIRTRETMEYALTFAETGHLVLATLHANNANQALERIMHFFPGDRHDQTLMDLSLNLKGLIAQQLIKTPDGLGRIAAVEVLLNTPLITDLIRKGDIHLIKNIMSKSRELGMQTFDQSLHALYNEGRISHEDALLHADSPNDLRLMIKLETEGKDQLMSATKELSIEDDESTQGSKF